MHWQTRIGTSARTSGVGTGTTGCNCEGFASSSYCPAGQTLSILDQIEQRPASQAGRGGKHMYVRTRIEEGDKCIRLEYLL